MSDRARWPECLRLSRKEFRESGGCLWRLVPKSPGGHIRVPSGTRFKIRISGPQRHDYASGTCRDGLWCVDSLGEFLSANQAVAAARPQVEASNAFLYVEFQVGNKWILADDLRNMPDLSLLRDEVEDIAFAKAKEIIREKARAKEVELAPAEVDAKAEQVLDTNENIWEYARLMAAPLDLSE
jgi:hypothetical protein